jgi:hypothetical protein
LEDEDEKPSTELANEDKEIIEENKESGKEVTDDDVKAKLDELKLENVEKTVDADDLAVEIEYIGEMPNLDDKDPNFQHFARIFNTFRVSFCMSSF